MTTEDYIKQYIGQLVLQTAMLQAQLDQLREPPVGKPVTPSEG